MSNVNFSHKFDEYIKAMPSLPTSVSKVFEICNNMNASPSDLNHVISLDPVLTGRVLKLINSAYYGLGPHVTSLARAIIMLGINTVKNLTLSTAILGTLPANKDHKGLNMEGFWRHSLCVGVTAKILAKKQGIDSKLIEEYFTAGLLHDIGKISLNAVMSGDYLLTVSVADREHKSLITGENSSLGIDHCAAGAMIVNAWKLEGPVADTIMHHHNTAAYTGDYADILDNIAIANYFTVLNEIGFAGDRNPVKPVAKIWEDSGIKENAFEEIIKIVDEEIEKAKIFLHI
ncbi:MAG: HDOD domain-containing protein [Treponema sp.]|jgi:putative nucleotidyltransferase with HDIG domain|nr:HDOD domain-containing protein [Treponema sp.]